MICRTAFLYRTKHQKNQDQHCQYHKAGAGDQRDFGGVWQVCKEVFHIPKPFWKRKFYCFYAKTFHFIIMDFSGKVKPFCNTSENTTNEIIFTKTLRWNLCTSTIFKKSLLFFVKCDIIQSVVSSLDLTILMHWFGELSKWS